MRDMYENACAGAEVFKDLDSSAVDRNSGPMVGLLRNISMRSVLKIYNWAAFFLANSG